MTGGDWWYWAVQGGPRDGQCLSLAMLPGVRLFETPGEPGSGVVHQYIVDWRRMVLVYDGDRKRHGLLNA